AAPLARAAAALVAIAVAGVLGACVTRAGPDVSHPAAIAQLRGFGMPATVSDELLAGLLEIQCARPEGATNRDMQPQLLRYAQSFDEAGSESLGLDEVTVVQMVEAVPSASCQPSRGPLAAFPVTIGTDHWTVLRAELAGLQDPLRRAIASSLTSLVGRPVAFDYATAGVLRMEVDLGEQPADVDLRVAACQTVRTFAGVLALLNLAPRDIALALGDHEPVVRVTVTSGSRTHVLDSSPGRLSDALAECASG
ncbi:MAG: hypothetical protein M3253_06130, partial [Chloroflexota bacterium]|nr:hypothetical protein [Chloroflexota bacterium]